MSKKNVFGDAAREWVRLKAEAKQIEKRLHELQEIIEPELREQKDKSVEVHGWRFKLCEYEQSSFRLKEAQEKIDGRVLSPYITKSQVVQIRTSWQGGEETYATA